MKIRIIITVFLAIILLILSNYSAFSWTGIPVKDDQNVFMPGSQPGTAGVAETPDKCDNCHGGYNQAIEPAYNWRGSMMAQAARDPLWLACMTTALQDSIWAVGNPNAGDICIRCHSPVGWLEGRSDPTNTSLLKTKDFDGVQCDFCHRMIDPLATLGQPDVGSEIPGSTAETMANETYLRDINVLSMLNLFNGTTYLDINTKLPTYYVNGLLPNYIEGASGQYFVDPSNAKSGPFWDADARHQFYYSRYHKSKMFCSTCHDVSNPILASVFIGPSIPETQAAASYFHVERTSSEFLLSAYGRGEIAGIKKCQDCHMKDVLGSGCDKPNAPIRNDLPLHDLTGGNAWISKILATADTNGTQFDPYNYKILSGQKYNGAMIDVSGLIGYGQALADGSNRAIEQLKKAASLDLASEDTNNITMRVVNKTAHKLISGFPEGRRMFLNVKFYDSNNVLISEINSYDPLVTTLNYQGNESYDSGGELNKTNNELVWEAEMSSSDLTGESKSFHFALATNRYKDNRIPPKGFDNTKMFDRLAQPRWEGINAPEYFTQAEYDGGYDEVNISKPAGTESWDATLYYQTTSKEYVEFLKNEINGGLLQTLSSPTPFGETNAYIVQTDPFFANLKGWGDAIWDLWLHNNGAEPVVMTSYNKEVCTIDAPQNHTATTSRKRRIDLSWDPVTNAQGYKIYMFENGTYNLIGETTKTGYSIKNLITGQTYTFVVTAHMICPDGNYIESVYSNPASAIAR